LTIEYVRSFCPTAALGGLVAAIVLRFVGVRSRNGLPAPAVLSEIFTVVILVSQKRAKSEPPLSLAGGKVKSSLNRYDIMVNKAWIENDKDITEGLISEINETENLDFFY
jgi:hypothetical protein